MSADTLLYSIAQIRDIEARASHDLSPGTLMQRAGKAAADAAVTLLGQPGSPVLVLAGPGNNGGDALEAAAHLEHAGYEIVVLLCADPARYSPEAANAYRKAAGAGVQFESPDFEPATRSWALAIDGLFGIGLARPITGRLRQLVQALDGLPCPVLALDIPSGLDADSGRLVASEAEAGIAVRATHTLTFIGNKPGLHTGSGRDYAGSVQVANLQISANAFPAPFAHLNGPGQFAHLLKRRRHDSHKGSYGDLALLGGAAGMHGAIILAARAAAMCGAGRVFAGFLDTPPAFDPLHPELMCRDAASLELEKCAVVAGPGLGLSEPAREILGRALQGAWPLLLDADALNLLARDSDLQATLAARQAATLLTPHPLEAARLLGMATAQVQADRIGAALQIAARFNAVSVLKGSGSVIADPQRRLVINTSGNPALATAGSGDVLSGIAGPLLAQGWPAWEAALAAVWMHGRAADELVDQGIGPIGLTAGELIPAVRALFNRITHEQAGN